MDDPTSDDWILESPNGNSHQLDRQISEVEFTRLADQFHNTGYREGVQRRKQLSIQEGFDQGFEVGAKRALRLGLLRGRASATLDILLKQAGGEDARVDRLRQLIRELNQHSHFQASPLDRDQIEGLADQMNGLMSSPSKIRACKSVVPSNNDQDQKLQDAQSTLDRCQFELDAILATMDILLQSP